MCELESVLVRLVLLEFHRLGRNAYATACRVSAMAAPMEGSAPATVNAGKGERCTAWVVEVLTV